MRRRCVLIACIVPWLCAVGSFADAGERHELDETIWMQDLPMVLTPSRLPSAQPDAPAAISVIDRDLIAATGYRDLPRLFRLVPGMQVGQERANTQWVTYHGLSNDFPSEMQVLIDGRSIFSPAAFGGVDWTTRPIAIEEVDRIEVVRGTDPVAFGTNAFLGAINIITRPAATTRGASVQATAGSFGLREARGAWALATAGGGIRIAGQAHRDNGFEGLHDSSRSAQLSAVIDQRLTLRDELHARLAYRRGERDAGYPDSIFDNNALRTDNFRVGSAHLQWRRGDSPDSDWLLNLYRNQDDIRDAWFASTSDNDLPGRPATRVPLNRNRESSRTSVELQRRQPLSDSLRTAWGAEVRRDTLDAPFFFFGRGEQNERLHRAFGSLEWAVSGDLLYHAGLLAEKVTEDRLRWAPRLFANWHTSPSNTLRAGYSRAWRQRNLFEVHGDIRAIDPNDGQLLVQPYQPNPSLRRARIDSVELGWLVRSASARGVLDVRAFNERIRDFVIRETAPFDPAAPDAPILASVIPPARYVNLASPVTLRGIEYEIRLQPRAASSILATHTLIDRRSSDPAVRERTAPYTASLTWIETWGRHWSSTMTVLRQGPLAGGDGFVPGFRYVARPYTTLDARIAWHGQWQDRIMEVALTGTNLGARHQEVSDRSEQFLHPDHPVNKTSPVLALTLRLELD